MTLSFRIMEEILNILDEDLETEAEKKYGNDSKQFEKAQRVGLAASYSIPDEQMEYRATNNDRGQEKQEERREAQGRKLPNKNDPDYDYERVGVEKAQDRHYAKELKKHGVHCALDTINQILSVLDEEGFTANHEHPVVKITDKNYRVASGKRLPGPFNKNHIGQYIVYNKDTDASYLVSPENWKNSKIKKDLESQGKFYEAFELMEDIISYADNIFELDIENKQNISPNKISKIKKDKDGKDVEVVSVADELFPHEGTAKQQFDKKILDKINAMIEGTGSLEDLIQFVRKGVQTKKMVHEDKNIFGHEDGRKSLENDILQTVTGKNINQHIENTVNKVMGEKHKEAN